MKIFNDNLKIEVYKDKILINEVELLENPQAIIEKIKYLTENIKYLNIDTIKHTLSKTEVIILLGLSYNIKYFYHSETNEKYELTFSYHFPLIYETHFIDIMINNIDFVCTGHLLNFATCGEFIKVNLSNELEQINFMKDYLYLIRHHDKRITMNKDKSFLKSILNNWSNFCKKKFNKTFSLEEIAAYNYFYSLNNFHVLRYKIYNEIISEGVVYFSNETHTLYYCIFWWNDKFKSLSPGIYNYSKTILYCIHNKLSFSFCYGVQSYKLKILKYFKNSNRKEPWSQLIYGDDNE